MGIGGTLREGSASLGALGRALAAAGEAGADTEILDLRELNLPMYEPGLPLEEHGPGAERLVAALRGADAVIVSTAAYHGTLAGVTKNALDFAQFLSGGEHPYFDGKVVGLISTAGGEQAGANATGAMVHVVHALRGVVAPLVVSIPKAWQRTDGSGAVTDESYGRRLDSLGGLVVDLAGGLAARGGPAGTELVGVAG
ncbi:NADPH-dependent FMN reductase [Rubrobacter tropicus]|uniref:NADPH-dependent FMN reductase n=1 Tax=Rubrobacter tropicus TaxID=2653851 RepID=UPI001D18CCDF|nr:NAD(P)H-dependent oxidoreductase [Rubrobacter tropicus]